MSTSQCIGPFCVNNGSLTVEIGRNGEEKWAVKPN